MRTFVSALALVALASSPAVADCPMSDQDALRIARDVENTFAARMSSFTLTYQEEPWVRRAGPCTWLAGSRYTLSAGPIAVAKAPLYQFGVDAAGQRFFTLLAH